MLRTVDALILMFAISTGTQAQTQIISLNTPNGCFDGEKFKIMVITGGTNIATFSDIAHYDNFVNLKTTNSGQVGAVRYIYNGVVVPIKAWASTSSTTGLKNTGYRANKTSVFRPFGILIGITNTFISANHTHGVNVTHFKFWTGTLYTGERSGYPLGGTKNALNCLGYSDANNKQWAKAATGHNSYNYHLYALSDPITVTGKPRDRPVFE